jgi:hypothetical protein
MRHIHQSDLLSLFTNALADGGDTLHLGEKRGRYVIGNGKLGLKYDAANPGLTEQSFSDVDSLVNHVTHIARYWAHLGYDTVGTWVDEGTLYLDPGNVTDDLDEARLLCAQRGEIAIWDTVEQCEVRFEQSKHQAA